MPLATEMRKLRETRVYCAATGAGDLAVEKLREVPGQLTKLQERTDAKDLGGAAVAYVAHFGARVVEAFDGLAERGRRVLDARDENPKPAPPELDEAAKTTARKAGETATAVKETARSAVAAGRDVAKSAKSAKDTKDTKDAKKARS